ncbi:hypothetical protein OAJ94_03155, partial [Deltaproteobacteria bacterium]|nr:hypothetical protein [Deltaproteobacteria bacterium]
YKIYCFYGKVSFITQRNVNFGKEIENWKYNCFDSNWDGIKVVYSDINSDPQMQPPEHAAELVKIAENISAKIPIPFVRIDLYSTDKGVAFGEFTFHPGTYKNHTLEWDQKLGQAYEDAEQRIKESGASLTDFIKEMRK